MPTTLTWDGSTSGDVNVAANWTPAQVPIDGDSIIIDGNTTQNITDSLGTFAAMKFPLFFVGPDATIDIGTAGDSGGSLRFAATKLVHQGSGTLYYFYPDSAANTTNDVVINSSNQVDAARLLASGATATDSLTIVSGNVIGGDATLVPTDIFISYRKNQRVDAFLTWTTTSGNLYMGGGDVTFYVPPANAYVSGGKLTVAGTGGGGSANLYIGGVAQVIYERAITLDLVELRSGELDLTQNSREVTITTLRRWPGTTLKTNELVTITTTEDMTGGDI